MSKYSEKEKQQTDQATSIKSSMCTAQNNQWIVLGSGM